MNSFLNIMERGHLGYAAVFVCIAFGFLFLDRIDERDVGPGYWTLSFFSNSLGFLFWSGIVPLAPRLYFLIGELFHIAGFFLLGFGAIKFTGRALKRRDFAVILLWAGIWLVSILLIDSHRNMAAFLLKTLRALIFIAAGVLVLVAGKKEGPVGRTVAGMSLIAWGVYVIIFAFILIDGYLYFGFLIGFHVLAAFGMVAMIVDKIRVRAEKSEKQVERLEGILPICSYCKKIRDEKNEWRILEEYIEDRSRAEFSHGICPDCFQKFRPDR